MTDSCREPLPAGQNPNDRTGSYIVRSPETGQDWESLVNEGIEARKLGDKCNWRLGDLAGQVETTYGGQGLAKYAKRINIAYNSLQEYRRVSTRFELSTRVDNLSWSHHRVVAARDDAAALLVRAAREDLTVEELRAIVDPVRAVLSSESYEWYTPKEYIEAARRVLGDIDLDPASSDAANETVQAERYFSQEDDGLAQEWNGRLWLNPPYGGAQAAFTNHLLAEYEQGHVTAAVLLVNSHATDTDWFAPLWDHLLCFTDHRIDFIAPSGEAEAGSTHGSVFAYLGSDWQAFEREFREFGAVVSRYRLPA